MFEPTRKTIANYIETNWDDSYPMFDENQGEVQPNGPFARFSIRPVETVSMAAGTPNARYRRTTALLWFQFFGVESDGTQDAMIFADKITNLFDEKWLSNSDGSKIRFQRNELQYIGIEPSGRPQWRCTVRYQVDDI